MIGRRGPTSWAPRRFNSSVMISPSPTPREFKPPSKPKPATRCCWKYASLFKIVHELNAMWKLLLWQLACSVHTSWIVMKLRVMTACVRLRLPWERTKTLCSLKRCNSLSYIRLGESNRFCDGIDRGLPGGSRCWMGSHGVAQIRRNRGYIHRRSRRWVECWTGYLTGVWCEC